MKKILLIMLLGFASCTEVYTVADPVDGGLLAKCYESMFSSFCQVAAPAGTVVVNEGSKAAGIGQLAAGVGMGVAGVTMPAVAAGMRH